MAATGLATLSGVHPAVASGARFAARIAGAWGVPVRITSGFRSLQKQAELRRAWLEGRSRFPANRPGDSAHNFGLAFDSTVPPHAQAFWDAVRRWVGFHVPENDRIHAEVPGWRSLVG